MISTTSKYLRSADRRRHGPRRIRSACPLATGVLFAIGSSYYVGTNYTTFDISPDDRRFLMVRQKGAKVEEAPRLIVVENCMEEVKGRVPN